MTIKQVQAKFIFDVENQKLSCPYDIYTVNSSYPFLAEYKDDKPCWTCQRDASGTGFGIVFTTDIIQVEFDLTVDNIDGFCVLVGINNTLSDGSRSRFHLVNVSKSYPSYGNYIWWNPDKAKINDGVLDANKWVHMVIDKTSITIYDLNSNLLYSRSKPEDIVDITLSSDENYQPYITNMTVTFNYSQSYLDTLGLTTLWSKIKSLFATKAELSNGLNSKANDSDVVHKSGDETITGSKTFSSEIKYKSNSINTTVTPTSNLFKNLFFTDVNDITLGSIYYVQRSSNNRELNFQVRHPNSTNYLNLNLINDGNSRRVTFQCEYVLPNLSTTNLGSSSNKWNNVYANTFNGNLTGNADTATKFANAISVNIADNDGSNIGPSASMDGSTNVIVNLPSTIKASITGTASSAVDCPNYLPLTGGKMIGSGEIIGNSNNDTYMNFTCGTDTNRGAQLQLIGDEWTFEPNRGKFFIKARDANNGCTLEGTPNGLLLWAGKHLDGIDSSSANWIRYTTGLQIIFSTTDVTLNNSATASTTVTFPIAFKDNLYQVITENSGGGTDFLLKMTTDRHTTTSFDLYCKNETNVTGTRQVRYIAIGFWK